LGQEIVVSLDQFYNNPKTYLKGHASVRINQTGQAFAALRAGSDLPVPNGGQSRQYTHQTGGPFVTLVPWMGKAAVDEKKEAMKAHNVVGRRLGLSPMMTRTYSTTASPGDIGVRWLPYQQGFVTYMEIDPAANFVGTGELTGCTVAVGSVGGHIYYFHSFCPAGNNGAAARTMQRNMIDHIGNSIGIGNMAYAENTIDYDGIAFGFGKLKKNTWKFYIYGGNSGVSKIAEF
jgi:hypothetical protein